MYARNIYKSNVGKSEKEFDSTRARPEEERIQLDEDKKRNQLSAAFCNGLTMQSNFSAASFCCI